jgi:DNA (cytosine-5)-methyltransferase 1
VTAELEELMPPSHRHRWQPLSVALAQVNGAKPEYIKYSRDRATVLAKVPAGKNWRWFRDNPEYGVEFTKEIMGGAWASGGGKVGFFRRLAGC